jgi:hypothetical protein
VAAALDRGQSMARLKLARGGAEVRDRDQCVVEL